MELNNELKKAKGLIEATVENLLALRDCLEGVTVIEAHPMEA